MVYGKTQCDPVGGDHGDLVAALAAFLKPQTYLELGVFEASTIMKVLPHVGRATGVDKDPAIHWAFDHPNLTLLKADSILFMRTLREASIEMVFLDSSHDFASTMLEVAEIERVIAQNGVLVMHDTYPPNVAQEQPGYCDQVWRAALEMRFRDGWESMTLPAQYGLTLARRLPKGGHLAWRA